MGLRIREDTGGGGRPPLRRGRIGVTWGWGRSGSRTAPTRGGEGAMATRFFDSAALRSE